MLAADPIGTRLDRERYFETRFCGAPPFGDKKKRPPTHERKTPSDRRFTSKHANRPAHLSSAALDFLCHKRVLLAVIERPCAVPVSPRPVLQPRSGISAICWISTVQGTRQRALSPLRLGLRVVCR